jgi:HPt (histidine-containing phosphotransfer) domain-containing protein
MDESAAIIDYHTVKCVAGLPGRKGPSLLPELLELYLRDEPERLERMARHLESRDFNSLANEAHSFGGNAASIGGTEVRVIALEFERVVRQGEWPSSSAGFERLKNAALRLRSEITRINMGAR